MTTSELKLAENLYKDFDAFSWYGVGAKKYAEPYADLAARCEDFVNKIGGYALAYNKGFIPSFTTGRDTLARIETGVSWGEGDPDATEKKDKPYGNKWAVQPTMEELEKHITNVYNYVQNNTVQTTPNMILSYGWNEHEEGGWLCPTLTCDENGNPVKDSRGNNKANDERLRTLNKVLAELRGDKAYSLGGETVEATPSPTPAVNGTDTDSFNVLWIIIPAVIIIGGVTAVVLLKKKSKKAE